MSNTARPRERTLISQIIDLAMYVDQRLRFDRSVEDCLDLMERIDDHMRELRSSLTLTQ